MFVGDPSLGHCVLSMRLPTEALFTRISPSFGDTRIIRNERSERMEDTNPLFCPSLVYWDTRS